jgi:hypothetical protein
MAVVAGVLLGVGLARWSAGQLSGLGAAATGGAPLAAPAAVLAVLGAAVLVVAAVRARAAVTADVPGVVREQVT